MWEGVGGGKNADLRFFLLISSARKAHIGSTHVAHHLCPQIPHYHAQEATESIKRAFPHLYLFDPTPVHWALWRICSNCVSVQKLNNMWVYTNTRTKHHQQQQQGSTKKAN